MKEGHTVLNHNILALEFEISVLKGKEKLIIIHIG
jgi:hypothetical protein